MTLKGNSELWPGLGFITQLVEACLAKKHWVDLQHHLKANVVVYSVTLTVQRQEDQQLRIILTKLYDLHFRVLAL